MDKCNKVKNLYLAKSKNKYGEAETIQEHTDKLVIEFYRMKNIYPNIPYLNWKLLKIACIYHDLGKINPKMQIKLGNLLHDISEFMPEIHHGYLSPAFLPKKYVEKHFTKEERKILYQSIYYHHTRPLISNLKDLKLTIEDLNKYVQDFKYDKLLPFEGLNKCYSKYVTKRITSSDGEIFKKYIMTKGLLNRLDYAASAGIPVELKNNNLYEKTEESIIKNGYSLNDLQKYMSQNQDENNVVVASTGAGKTEAALLWIGNNKGFFTLPLKVSINAIYDRIVDVNRINFGQEKTGLLHSDTYAEYLYRPTDDVSEAYINQTKQLGLPLTVCTLDQIVDFIFKYPGFELKLATLAYSKLVIDEIQMYSPEMIGFLLLALKYIDDMGGKFSIVTATLPGIIIDFLNELNINFKVSDTKFIKQDYNTGEAQVRHKIKVLEKNITEDDILANEYKDKKVLVIANTVKESQHIYNRLKSKLPDGFNLNLLHSRFIKKDRKKKEKEILEMGKLSNDTSGIWVTTQIVEASLDIDFDVLYTELSDITGLMQRMGRVFRNRYFTGDGVNIYVYVGNNVKMPSGIGRNNSIVDIDIFKLSKQTLLNYGNKVLTELDKMDMVSNVYSKEKIKYTKYYKTIEDTISYYKDIVDYSFNKSDINLRKIYTENFIPTSVYIQNKVEIDSLCEKIEVSKNKSERELYKSKLKDFTVSLECYKTFKSTYYTILEISKYENLKVLDFDYDDEIGIVDRSDTNINSLFM